MQYCNLEALCTVYTVGVQSSPRNIFFCLVGELYTKPSFTRERSDRVRLSIFFSQTQSTLHFPLWAICKLMCPFTLCYLQQGIHSPQSCQIGGQSGVNRQLTHLPPAAHRAELLCLCPLCSASYKWTNLSKTGSGPRERDLRCKSGVGHPLILHFCVWEICTKNGGSFVTGTEKHRPE